MPIEIVESKNQFHVRYKARNGEVVAWTENYRSRSSAKESIGILREILNESDDEFAPSAPPASPSVIEPVAE